MQNKQHPHKDLIIAWANGAEIEYQSPTEYGSNEWQDAENPGWYPDYQYRIKPVEPPKAEWIFCDGKRPEGIPNGVKVLWYSPQYFQKTAVLIDSLNFTGQDKNPVMFIKIIED